MEYKKDFLGGENIPDFALQPARPASTFDPTAYDKLFENLKQAKVSQEEGAVPLVAAVDAKETEAPAMVAAEEAEESAAVAVEEAEESIAVAEEEMEEGTELAVASVTEEAIETAAEAVEAAAVEASEIGHAEDPASRLEEDCEGPAVVAELDSAEEEIAEDVMGDQTEDAKLAVAEVKDVAAATKPAMARPVAEKHKIHEKKLVPIPEPGNTNANIYREVTYTNFRDLDPIKIKIEEDVLITDAKPDMGEMLWVEGNCHMAERSLRAGGNNVLPVRLSGDIKIQALYSPAKNSGERGIISLDVRIPFRDDSLIKMDPNGEIALDGRVKSLNWERINERKFRVSCEIEVGVREYSKKNMDIFEGVQNEQLQLLHKEVDFTDIAIRKSDVIEISEEFSLPDGAAEIENISCFNVSVTEKHRQISDDKAMVNGEAYINVLVDSIDGPTFYGFNSNFTHFVKIGEEIKNPLTGGCVNFNLQECSLTPKRDEDGYYKIIELDMEVGLDLECYCQNQEQWVADAYHSQKDVSWDERDIELNRLVGIESTDLSIREIIDLPEKGEKIGKVIYIGSEDPVLARTQMEKGIMSLEGLLPIRLICVAEENDSKVFYIKKDIKFIAEMNIDGCREEMQSDCKLALKHLSFDRINNRQVSVNADLKARGCVFDKTLNPAIHSVNIMAREEEKRPQPSIIVYSAKNDDTVWKVAKRYSTLSSRLRLINNLDEHEEIKPGSKVLIVR